MALFGLLFLTHGVNSETFSPTALFSSVLEATNPWWEAGRTELHSCFHLQELSVASIFHYCLRVAMPYMKKYIV